jgi:hypothetical protein
MLQFGNRLACLPMSHLCRQLYDGWTDNRRLKRSSPLQWLKDLHRHYDLAVAAGVVQPVCEDLHGASHLRCPPSAFIVQLDLDVPCSKSDDPTHLRVLGNQRIASIPESHAIIFTDGSASKSLRMGGSGGLIQWPGGRIQEISISSGRLSSNYIAEVKAIRAALDAVIKSDLAPPKGITLLSDSQAALRALASSSSKSFLINEIHCLVRQL